MMDKIKNNPKYTAIFYFLLTWAGFPLAALVRSAIRDITFAEAAFTPYMIGIFATGSIIAAVQMYWKTKNACITK